MNNNLLNQSTRAAQEALKLVAFSVGNLNLALPIKSVQKILNRITVYGSGLHCTGIAHLENQEVTVIDLHELFFKVSLIKASGSQGYLVLAKNRAGEQLGILVSETPTLIDVPLSQVRVLPESYRRADTLDLASHVAIIPEPTPKTFFVLDVDLLLPKVSV